MDTIGVCEFLFQYSIVCKLSLLVLNLTYCFLSFQGLRRFDRVRDVLVFMYNKYAYSLYIPWSEFINMHTHIIYTLVWVYKYAYSLYTPWSEFINMHTHFIYTLVWVYKYAYSLNLHLCLSLWICILTLYTPWSEFINMHTHFIYTLVWVYKYAYSFYIHLGPSL